MSQHVYIGLMSGTSLDGLDAVLVDLTTAPGQILASTCCEFSKTYTDQVNQLIQQPDWQTYGSVHTEYARYANQAITQLLNDTKMTHTMIQAIGSHGQTIWHQPDGHAAFSLQLGDPSRIAAATGIPVVADFRNADIALGGQGAPLVPAFHEWLFADSQQTRIIANIGGIANISVLQPEHAVIGYDTGPGNGLLNAWVQTHFNQPYDDQGQLAASGVVQPELLNAMLADDYFQQPPPKSTGREHFNEAWLSQFALEAVKPVDVLATLTQLTAQSLANAWHQYKPDQVLVCGGGVHNHELMQQLQSLSTCSVKSTQVVGANPDWIEAVAFAWLSKQRLAKQTGSLAAVTGASHDAVLGGLYWPIRNKA